MRKAACFDILAEHLSGGRPEVAIPVAALRPSARKWLGSSRPPDPRDSYIGMIQMRAEETDAGLAFDAEEMIRQSISIGARAVAHLVSHGVTVEAATLMVADGLTFEEARKRTG